MGERDAKSLVALSFAPQVAAFGAGNIPSYSHLEDRAFRHGDIEDIIEKCEFDGIPHASTVNAESQADLGSVQGSWWWFLDERIQV